VSTDREHRPRLTDAELTAEAARLLPAEPPLPPMPLLDILEYVTGKTRELQADLWTLRDAVDAHLTGTRHAAAVAALAELAAAYDDASTTARTLAADLGIRLPADLYGPSSC
jgi:hypothetical protein